MPNNKKKKGKDRLDKYYHLAKDQGYRARSAFKLIQLAKKVDFLSKSKVCIDLCAAPGGWCQVAQRNMPAGSQIIGIDLAPIKPIPGCTFMQVDITTDKCRSMLKKELKGARADCVLHDGAPNVGCNWSKDAFSQAELTLHSMKLACEFLKVGGTFVTKVFRSADYNSLLWVFKQLFNKVDATKPQSSRNVSAEIFVMCIGFKGGKIDPRFFDTKWVFMENLDPLTGKAGGEDEGPAKKPGASLAEYMKNAKKRHRGGYEEGDDLRIIPAHEFITSSNPAEILINTHRLNLEAPGSEPYKEHKLTTQEIRDLCADLKVLGKGDLSSLLKWRARILREEERAEMKAAKAKKEEASALAVKAKEEKKASKAAAAAARANSAIQPGVDDAIAELLDGADGSAKPSNAAAAAAADLDLDEPSDSEDEAEDERLEQELQTQLDKRRREERREGKRLMERQKKQELRKKMSLGTKKGSESADQPELFKITEKSIKALEDASAFPKELEDSDEEDENQQGPAEESDSDDEELDRISRMELDLAVQHEIAKAKLEDKCRNASQRMAKRKKETRRQRVMAAWAGELGAFNEAIQDQAAVEREKQLGIEEDKDDDSDDDLEELRAFRRKMANGPDKNKGMDVEALEALVDGPDGDAYLEAVENSLGGSGERPKKRAKVEKDSDDSDSDDEEDEEDDKQIKALAGSDDTALAIEDDEDTIRGEHRASRWFSQDIFQGMSKSNSKSESSTKSRALARVEKFEDRLAKGLDGVDDSDSEDGEMVELDDAHLPKLPLTDKEKRKKERKREEIRLQKLGIKPKNKKDDEEEKGPLEVAPLEAPKSIVGISSGKSKFQKPDDPRELAETLALGSLLVESKKSRMELIDAAYNRWTFDQNDALPSWFTEEEEKYNKPELPISKEQFDLFRQKLREINARPIRKVAEARARKKRRLGKKLEKLRGTALALSETSDMSEVAKSRQMRKAMNQLAKTEQRKVTTVAIKKGGGGNRAGKEKGKVPKGAKLKVVDRRMKSDRRGLKKAAKRNPSKVKMQQRKQQKKIARGTRRGKGDKGEKTGKKRGGGGGVHGSSL
eukprot:TRINITY_DN229_c2_g1_i1.p1 TRINITY_DN229_c2_g1~~TRINITY_DN229_c2_g1_i1.p1  ORF type:complete len:1075 (-),score=353.04 TRINITY_DN229_c2_g1_i1:211-3435(-)